jgi:probable F420-dependent oxidoreductase
MDIDVIDIGADIASAVDKAVAAEAAGYDGYTVAEVSHDPFLPLVGAAEHTTHVALATNIAGAFSRNPTTLAHLAWDLQVWSAGRFTLGIGPLVEAHVRGRFGMEWRQPAPRMRELVLAIRAVWDCWSTGGPLQFDGDHYRLSVMPPFFRPDPRAIEPYGRPDILVAAVGPRITEVAGEVADGYVAHAFTTPEYLDRVTLPALDRGLARSGRRRDDVTIAAPVFVVTGRTDEEMATATAATRQQIAFYASEPTYRGVLDVHGWGGVQDDLAELLAAGRMAELGSVVDDTMLHAFAVVAEPDAVVARVHDRVGVIADRVSLYTPYPTGLLALPAGATA